QILQITSSIMQKIGIRINFIRRGDPCGRPVIIGRGRPIIIMDGFSSGWTTGFHRGGRPWATESFWSWATARVAPTKWRGS
ncbi:MAG: hypothetical protein LBN93_11885, partial [Candidatus Symbiothrix sp.]|nr:hypothetical protein [Candidatus Symbiothrix sp.]